ncbi:MAG: HAD family phosphatase [Planctomycetota bacterium]
MSPTLSAPPVRAVLFDFDGVVADTETIHFQTFAATLAEVGIIVTPEEHAADYMGIDDAGCFRVAHEKKGRPNPSEETIDQLLRRKSELYDASLHEIGIFAGFREVLEAAQSRGPFTIASCGRRRDIEAVLGQHELLDRFPAFISADEIERPKPDPDCFLRAYRLLRDRDAPDLKPEDCLVFEDSVRGVQAAKTAGMRCVALTHSFPAEKLQHADLVLTSWTDWEWPA